MLQGSCRRQGMLCTLHRLRPRCAQTDTPRAPAPRTCPTCLLIPPSQTASTLIGVLGFNGYEGPRDGVSPCQASRAHAVPFLVHAAMHEAASRAPRRMQLHVPDACVRTPQARRQPQRQGAPRRALTRLSSPATCAAAPLRSSARCPAAATTPSGAPRRLPPTAPRAPSPPLVSAIFPAPLRSHKQLLAAGFCQLGWLAGCAAGPACP